MAEEKKQTSEVKKETAKKSEIKSALIHSDATSNITGATTASVSNAPNDTITINKNSLWKYSTFILLAVVIIGGFVAFKGDSGGTITGNTIAAPTPSAPTTGNAAAPTPSQVKVSVDDDAVLGNKEAKVALIEFTDFECPFCGRHHQQTYSQIKSQYVDAGKIKYVYRDFPLGFHQNAEPGALAAECLREQTDDETYFKYVDKIFSNQQTLSTENYRQWAIELGADGAEYDSCISTGKYKAEVNKDLADGQAAGIRGTPGFIVLNEETGQTWSISGAQPFEAFQSQIEAALAS